MLQPHNMMKEIKNSFSKFNVWKSVYFVYFIYFSLSFMIDDAMNKNEWKDNT